MTINRQIARKLTDKKWTLSTAESCTGGLISKMLTDIPGSSAFFKAGLITYADEAKHRFLGVPLRLIKEHGAVSSCVACAMVKGARQAAKTDFAVAITGIAGPSGGTPAKPVGLAYIATASSRTMTVRRFRFKGTRQQVRALAAKQALKLLLQMINKTQ